MRIINTDFYKGWAGRDMLSRAVLMGGQML